MNRNPAAFVTGASRGIGRGIAIELAKQGYDVAGSARTFDPANTETGLFEVKQRVEEAGAAFLAVQGNVERLEDHAPMLDLIEREFGCIDLFVSNAGVAPEQRMDVLETSSESFDRVMSINLRGAFFLTQATAARMIASQNDHPGRTRRIVFITSVSADTSSPSRAEYCISKAGLSMAASIYAHRLAEFGIPVFEIRPGVISTDMTATVRDKYDRLIGEGLIPQQRWGSPEDVGKAVAALASGAFDYSTGAIIEVSGGMNLKRL